MVTPEAIAAALAAAGVEKLPPTARAYLGARIVRTAALDTFNVGGLRDASFGGGGKLASYKDLDTAMAAHVAVSYRAAPRRWGDIGEVELNRLGGYPITREGAKALGAATVPVPEGEGVAYVVPEIAMSRGVTRNEDGSWNLSTVQVGEISEFKWSYLIPGYGPYSAIKDYLGPTEEAQKTFRGLMADWEGYDRIGVGEKVLPVLRDDVIAWRKFRDTWIAGDIPANELGGQLNVQVGVSNKVRRYLADAKVIDPVLADPVHDRKGVDVEQSTTALQKAATVNEVAKSNWFLNWLTDPGNKTNLPVVGAVPTRALWVTGLGIVLGGFLYAKGRRPSPALAAFPEAT